MDTSNVALICVGAAFVVLLVADLVLSIVVIMKMRGRGEPAMPRTGTDRAFFRGWKYPDLRPFMIGWALAVALTCVVTCSLLVMFLQM